MALLTLKDIGKIYVSEGNVAVGIRGVNLSFDRGEFVAVTGKSGSGKSTLLNVISGMDSYEEGELFIEGETTSHYLQPEWEQYREKYISFIFQDYNIIESFTVLQNVELALLHIENPKERRQRALELIRRVGLASHLRQKGSKLSGGQKQRTVIARALAKDSPIILADEPTGNLDHATSKEIIALLREVSRDKLLIMVPHNFDQVEDCATRHIRIFDGAIEADHVIKKTETAEPATPTAPRSAPGKRRDVKNGLKLGGTIFAAKPKLSCFLAFLMIVGMLGIFAVTTLCGSATDMFDKHYMFHHIDGRVVLAHRDGSPLTDAELLDLQAAHGAVRSLHYDALLDDAYRFGARIGDRYISLSYTYGEDYGTNIVGRYPTAADEVFLYLPIYLQSAAGKDTLLIDTVDLMGSFSAKVVGVAYYFDNNLTARCLFTEEGFRYATAQRYLQDSSTHIEAFYTDTTGAEHQAEIYSFRLSSELAPGKIALAEEDFLTMQKNGKLASLSLQFSATYYRYDYFHDDGEKHMTFSKSFTLDDVDTDSTPSVSEYGKVLMMSPETLTAIAEEALGGTYRQASLFFENDAEAKKAARALQEAGYIAVPSYTEYTPEPGETVLSMVASIFLALIWLLAIVFLAFFINLCSGRALSAFKGDMAIMRSMGIPVRVIRVGMYVRMLLSLVPACVLLAVLAVSIFTSPRMNEFFVYLYAWQYAAIYLGMILLTVRITYTQVKRLFGESVKKSLKGGGAA